MPTSDNVDTYKQGRKHVVLKKRSKKLLFHGISRLDTTSEVARRLHSRKRKVFASFFQSDMLALLIL